MALTSTLSGGLSDAGIPFSRNKAMAWVVLDNATALVDTETDRLLVGRWPLTLDESGNFSVGLPSTASGAGYSPDGGFAYRLFVEYRDSAPKATVEKFSSQPFFMPTDQTLTEALGGTIELTAVSAAEWIEFEAKYQAIKDVVATTDGVMAAAIVDPESETAGALAAVAGSVADDRIDADASSPTGSTVRKAKEIAGGQFPAPFRVPVLTTKEVWPTPRDPYELVWSEADVRYAFGRDGTLRKSTDKGKTWAKRGYNAFGFGAYGCFLKLATTGTLLNIHSVSGAHIQRSTDDGATWISVYDFRTGTTPLGSQAWAVHPVTGHIYVGEYGINLADVRVLRSTDDGATWSTFATWPGETTPAGTPNRIRHVHAITADPVAGRVVISLGDSTPATGLWRDNAAGTGVEPIVTNAMLSAADLDLPRSIGVIPFPDYIAWAGDTTLQPYVSRMARSEIGKPSPVVERIYKLNSTAWYACRASDDGSRWVVSASQEGASSLDGMVHLYAVEDQGATVWEIGAMSTNNASAVGSLQPVGRPEMHGSTFVLGTRNMSPAAQYRLELGRGNVAQLAAPPVLPDCPVTFTASTAAITLAPSEERVIGHTVAGGLGRKLHIFETGIYAIDMGGASAGSQRLRVRKAATAHVLEFLNISDRYSGRLELGGALTSHTFTNGDTVEFYLRNNSTTATTVVTGSITYGWSAA